jgi:hypothetical protein
MLQCMLTAHFLLQCISGGTMQVQSARHNVAMDVQVTENKEFTEACLAAHPLYLAPKALQPGALHSRIISDDAE